MTALKTLSVCLISATVWVFSPPSQAAKIINEPIVSIEKRQNIKVVYDVSVDSWEAGVGQALYYVRGLVESYKSMGVAAKQLHISIVVHGAPTYWLLNNTATQIRSDDPFDYNSNEHVVTSLIEHGVSVEVCNVSLKAKHWTAQDLLPGVIVVKDAYTRIIDLQQRGYAYIRF